MKCGRLFLRSPLRTVSSIASRVIWFNSFFDREPFRRIAFPRLVSNLLRTYMNGAIRILLMAMLCAHSFAFSLLGPSAPWMTPQQGFPADAGGGPMQLDSGYRWNVPVITYGFDQSFMDFFGERGMAAVEEAIRQLSAVTDAEISTVPANVLRLHATAQQNGVLDLKSFALALTLEQMGLAQALPNIYVIRSLNITSTETNYFIAQRNFNPTNYTASDTLNGIRFLYETHAFPDGSFDAIEYPIDQSALPAPGVAGTFFNIGQYAQTLSRDDAGGLRYLYATNNYKMETLLPNIEAEGELANAAVRPGRGKLQFARQYWNFDNSAFNVVTQFFGDIYIQNGVTKTQQVRRLVITPDITFSAQDLGVTANATPVTFARTPATQWINNSTFNRGQAGEGPGLIAPPITIILGKLIPSVSFPAIWGVFDSNTFYAFDGPSDNTLPKLELLSKNDTTVTLKLTGIRRKYVLSSTSDFQTWSVGSTISNVTTSMVQLPIVANGNPVFYRAVEGSPY